MLITFCIINVKFIFFFVLSVLLISFVTSFRQNSFSQYLQVPSSKFFEMILTTKLFLIHVTFIPRPLHETDFDDKHPAFLRHSRFNHQYYTLHEHDQHSKTWHASWLNIPKSLGGICCRMFCGFRWLFKVQLQVVIWDTNTNVRKRGIAGISEYKIIGCVTIYYDLY